MKSRGRPPQLKTVAPDTVVEVPAGLVATALKFQRAETRTRTFLTLCLNRARDVLVHDRWSGVTLPADDKDSRDFFQLFRWAVANAEDAASERGQFASILLYAGVPLDAARAVREPKAKSELDIARQQLADAQRRVLELMAAEVVSR